MADVEREKTPTLNGFFRAPEVLQRAATLVRSRGWQATLLPVVGKRSPTVARDFVPPPALPASNSPVRSRSAADDPITALRERRDPGCREGVGDGPQAKVMIRMSMGYINLF